jgi:pimeloyl-ACP methyl ester carboxylesterase
VDVKQSRTAGYWHVELTHRRSPARGIVRASGAASARRGREAVADCGVLARRAYAPTLASTACLAWLTTLVWALGTAPLPAQELGQEGYADSDGVKIHYVTLGQGPLVVMLHGFPDYWYTWRDQMPALAKHFQVVAVDLRGYNKSGRPEGVANYAADKLVGDVAAVVKHFQRDKAVIVGHDWGGLIAWTFAMTHPDRTDRLVVLNLPHPKGLMRELANNPQQQKNSAYARAFQQPDAHKKLMPEFLALWVKEPEARKHYVEAFKRSSMEAMLNYYKANYPREPYQDDKDFPKVKCPVLLIHGLDDPYLLPGALNDTWKWLEKDLTLVTIPKAGHFVHRDAAPVVTRTMLRWLRAD